MEAFGQMKEDFLREFLELPHGIPRHDAYSRLFRRMTPGNFQALFDKLRADLTAGSIDTLAIAIDGNDMRRSFDRAAEASSMTIVTAFAHDPRLTLGLTKSAKGGSDDCLKLKGNQGSMLVDTWAFVEIQGIDYIW